MELARGTTPAVGINPEDEVFTWPHLVFREILLFLATLAVLLILAIFWNAPLEEIANPVHPPNPAKAPWYFLGLQELVSYSAFWGGVVVPALLVTALVALPYLDRKRKGVGVWFSGERKVALTVFIGLPGHRGRPDGYWHGVPRAELVIAVALETYPRRRSILPEREPWTPPCASFTPGSRRSACWSAGW